MIFITGADYRFKEIVEEWIKKVSGFGYPYIVYDLGNLGFGKKGFEENDMNFKTRGYYNDIGGNWKSTGLWKRRVISDALNSNIDNIVYLDADAHLQQPIAIDFSEFDIGMVRREFEFEADQILNPTKVFLRGDYNAGVIFLSNNEKVKKIVEEWDKGIKKMSNDQAVLSMLLHSSSLRIKVFPETYNTKKKTSQTIIYHYTGGKKNGKAIRQSYL